jgi:hypothetical protein
MIDSIVTLLIMIWSLTIVCYMIWAVDRLIEYKKYKTAFPVVFVGVGLTALPLSLLFI